MPRLRDLLPTRFLRPHFSELILERPPEGKEVNTSYGGPNMPRYQFCNCGLSSRRVKKTVSGALYDCRCHGEFFVKAA